VTDRQTVGDTIEALERCLRAHDREGAVRAVLAAVENGLAIEDLYAHVLEPFLASVGQGWQERRTAVWEEHLIVGAVRGAIEALYPQVLERKAQVAPISLTVAFFCPPEETHDVGLRMLVDRFDLRGFRTIYVGAATPVNEMVRCVRAERASVVCLSASTHYQRTALHDVVAKLRELLPDVRLVVGGPAFAHTAAGWEDYAVESVDLLMDELAAQARGTQAGAAGAGAAGPPTGGAAAGAPATREAEGPADA
jgi:MerR family transcriptional regulator, light-induced transcriptional regulator